MFKFNRVWLCGVAAVVLGAGLLAGSAAGTDLAADRIEFRLDQKYADPSMAKISIIGYVKEVTGSAFPGAASARLYAVHEGKENLVAQAKLPALQPGQELPVPFQCKWGLNWVMIMPTHFKLVVLVNPDINDNPTNNVKVRSTADIASLFTNKVEQMEQKSTTGLQKRFIGRLERIK